MSCDDLQKSCTVRYVFSYRTDLIQGRCISYKTITGYCSIGWFNSGYTTVGTVSRYGLVAYASSLDQIGPVGKDVSDCAALLEIIAGHDTKDSTSMKREDLQFSKELTGDIRGMKFGVPEEYQIGRASCRERV